MVSVRLLYIDKFKFIQTLPTRLFWRDNLTALFPVERRRRVMVVGGQLAVVLCRLPRLVRATDDGVA
jgi:hypothetical protein